MNELMANNYCNWLIKTATVHHCVNSEQLSIVMMKPIGRVIIIVVKLP